MGGQWAPNHPGAWRSGLRTGPFTVDSGGGPYVIAPHAHELPFMGSLPAQPHPAFAAAQTVSQFSARPAPLAVQAQEMAFSPVSYTPTGSSPQSRSARSSRTNSVSAPGTIGLTPLASTSTVKPYARPPQVVTRVRETHRPTLSLPSSGWVDPANAAQRTRQLHSRTRSAIEPLAPLHFDEVERNMRLPAVEPASAASDQLPAGIAVAHTILSSSSSSLADLASAGRPDESPEELAANDPLATQLWKFFAKAKKSAMPHASRMENLAWRVGGLKLAEINANKSEEEDRGRKSRSAEPVLERESDEMDWRAKSRSRSRAAERWLEGMDWRGHSRSRSRARVDDLRFPGASEPAAPVLSMHDAWPFEEMMPSNIGLAIPENEVAFPDIPHLSAIPSDDAAAVSRLFGLDSYSAVVAPESSSSHSTSSSLRTAQMHVKTERTRSPHRTHDDAMRRRALGSVVGVTGEASLQVNQDPTYGFLPRVVRKTSFDGTQRSGSSSEKVSPAQTQPTTTPANEASYTDNWARLLEPRAESHDVLPPSSLITHVYGNRAPLPPTRSPLPAELQYPYAFNLANKHVVPMSAMRASESSLVMPNPPLDPPSALPSPFRTSYGFESAYGSKTSFVNPSMVLNSAPPTAAPSPTAHVQTQGVANSEGSSHWSQSPASTQPSPARSAGEDSSGTRSRQSTAGSVMAPALGPSGEVIVCTNCNTSNTPLWRRDEAGRPLCNGCGLFRKLHGVDRPLSLATGIVKKRNRSRAKDAPKKATSASRAARRSSTS